MIIVKFAQFLSRHVGSVVLTTVTMNGTDSSSLIIDEWRTSVATAGYF
jgi:hypothetical protein